MKFSLALTVLAISTIVNGAAVKRFNDDAQENKFEGDDFDVKPVTGVTLGVGPATTSEATHGSAPSVPAQFKENPFWGWWFLWTYFPHHPEHPGHPEHKSHKPHNPKHSFTKFENHTLSHFPTPTFSFPSFPTGFPSEFSFPPFPTNFTFPHLPTGFSFPAFPTEFPTEFPTDFSFPAVPTDFSLPPLPTDFSFPALPSDFSFPSLPTEFSFPAFPTFSVPEFTIPTTHEGFPTPTFKAPTLPTIAKDPFTFEEPKEPSFPTAKAAEPKEGFF